MSTSTFQHDMLEGNLHLLQKSNSGDSSIWKLYRCKLNRIDGSLTFWEIDSKLATAARRMLAPGGVKIKTRTWLLRRYVIRRVPAPHPPGFIIPATPQFAVYPNFTEVLCTQSIGPTKEEFMTNQRDHIYSLDACCFAKATTLLRSMVARGMVTHVCAEHDFEDKFLYYRFTPEHEWDTSPSDPQTQPSHSDGGDAVIRVERWRAFGAPNTKTDFFLKYPGGVHRLRARDRVDRRRWLCGLAAQSEGEQEAAPPAPRTLLSRRPADLAGRAQAAADGAAEVSPRQEVLATSAQRSATTPCLGSTEWTVLGVTAVAYMLALLCAWLRQWDLEAAGSWSRCARLCQAAVLVLLLLRAYLYCARVVVTQKDGVGYSSWLRCVLRCTWRSGSEETGARLGPLDALGMRECEREVERRFEYVHQGERRFSTATTNPPAT